jgi:hypothetical protein
VLERVGRIAGIKKLKFSNDELFERKRGYEEKEERETFASIFEEEKQKKRKNSQEERQNKNEAYTLEVGRATQSLFYRGQVDLSAAREKLPNAG